MTGLATHRGVITGIQRVQLGIANSLLRDALVRDVAFCVFENKLGFRAISRSTAAAIAAYVGGGARSWLERSRSRFLGLRKVRRWLLRRISAIDPFEPGDVLMNLGFANYGGRRRDAVEQLLAARGVRYVGMIYDLLTLTHPEWWDRESIEGHRAWFAFTCRRSDPILCCSAATQRDVEWFLSAEGIAPRRIQTVRLADEISPAAPTSARESWQAPLRPYVLYVSQLDVRKNHRLLLEVWRRLVAAHGVDRVPDLLCVGRLGFDGEELLREMQSAPGGRIQIRRDVSDAELARLYGGCLFTVYPSIAEGWGLPIGESLGHGKYCIASSSSSLPEIGGDLVDYHDPTDPVRATELIARAAFDAEFRAAREAAIRRRYRGRTWRDSLDEMLRAVADPAVGGSGAATAAP